MFLNEINTEHAIISNIIRNLFFIARSFLLQYRLVINAKQRFLFQFARRFLEIECRFIAYKHSERFDLPVFLMFPVNFSQDRFFGLSKIEWQLFLEILLFTLFL